MICSIVGSTEPINDKFDTNETGPARTQVTLPIGEQAPRSGSAEGNWGRGQRLL
jgi:hypothetical protein